MKHLIGIDIGSSAIKLAQVSGGKVVRTVSAELPEGLMLEGHVLSPAELGLAIKGVCKEAKLRGRQCALVLPPETAFARKLTMPYMTTEQLKLNLPYELQDYIQNDKEQYFYDYAVLSVNHDEEGRPTELELLAAATPRSVIEQYRTALKTAGLKLYLAVPETLTYRNIIRSHELTGPNHPGEYCIADLGHSSIRVHMFRGAAYETSRVIEYGGKTLDRLIADALAVEPHSASSHKVDNFNRVQELPACREVYGHIAVEIMRAVNFYGFNTPESDLRDIYFSGGLAQIGILMDEIRQTLSLNCHPIEDLLPPGTDGSLEAPYAAAVGAALQSNGR